MRYFLPFAASLIISLVLTPAVSKFARRFGFLSKPNQLRWHKNATPVLGGIAIYLAFFIPVLFLVKIDKNILGLLTGSSLIFLFGLADDIFQIQPQLKIIGQIATACIVLAFGITFEIFAVKWVSLPLTIFWLVGIANAFNLLDNMDGLSAGIALICSGFLFVYSLLNGMHLLALLAIILAGSCLGFLRHNFYPAKIFMGDCGSQFLGIAIAILAVIGTAGHISNLVVTLAIPVLILGVPIFDTTFVTLVRKLKGQPISQGGRDHTSHRLVLLGLSELKTVLLLYFLSILFGLIALLYTRIDVLIVSILAALTVIILFFFGVFLGETKTYSDKEIENLKKSKLGRTKTALNTIILHKRRVAEVIIDLLLICIAHYAAYLLRFEGKVSDANFALIRQSLPWLVLFRMGSFYYFGLYQGIWRYISIKDLTAIFKAVATGSVLTILFLTFFFRFNAYSRVVFIIDGVLMLFLAAGTRVLIRIMRESFLSLRPGEKKVLIFGAGDAGEMVLREIRHNKSLNYHPIGFLDDDRKKVGRRIHGVSVLGTREKLKDLVKERRVEEIIVAIPSAKPETLDSIFQQCKECGVEFKRMVGVLWK